MTPQSIKAKVNTYWGMNHLNSNLLCAVDVETTGFDPDEHGIIEICILPLNSRLQPHEHFPIFNMRMKPEDGEPVDQDALRVTKLTLAQIVLQGFPRDNVADYLVNWFDSLGLPPGKKIIPLACNWPFDRSMILKWLGKAPFESIFHFHYRDIMPASLYLNDCADSRAEEIPFPKIGLQYMCTLLKVDQIQAHTAASDCLATAEVYKKLLTYRPGLFA